MVPSQDHVSQYAITIPFYFVSYCIFMLPLSKSINEDLKGSNTWKHAHYQPDDCCRLVNSQQT